MKGILKRGLALLLAVTITSGSLSGLTLKAEAEEVKVETVSGNEVSEEVTTLSEKIAVEVDTSELPDNEELYAGYVENLFYSDLYGDISTYANVGASKLEGMEKLTYDELKAAIKKIAAGQETSTVITLGQDITWTWTAEELGTTITEENHRTLASTKFAEVMDTGKVIAYLLMDCPYDFYWYDKTEYSYTGYSIGYTSTTLTVSNVTMQLPVAAAFQKDDIYTFDTTTVEAASAAKAKAEAIVKDYDSMTAYEQMLSYKTEICNLVSYNDEAADSSNNTAYGNPWQLVWVFDSNPDTNVVCEGYSKAFQYLCDLAGLTCYTVTGTMKSGEQSGGHMWNIVTLDGANYLVDVTNCDEGAIGADDKLFLAGTSKGGFAAGYTFELPESVTYVYDNDQVSLLGADTLTLAEASYDPNYDIPGESEDQETVTVPAPSMELYRDENGDVAGVQITNNMTTDNGKIWYGYCWDVDGNKHGLRSYESFAAGETKTILFMDMLIPDIDYVGKAFSFECYAENADSGEISASVVLDYEITMEEKNYTGDNILVTVETDEENQETYWIEKDILPEQLRIMYLTNSAENVAEGYDETYYFAPPWPVEGRTCWEASYTDALISIESLTLGEVVASESGLKFVWSEVPNDKITVEYKDGGTVSSPNVDDKDAKAVKPELAIERDEDGKLSGITITNNHTETVEVYWGLTSDGVDGFETATVLVPGETFYCEPLLHIQDEYKAPGTYNFAAYAVCDGYADSEVATLDYSFVFTESIVEDEASVSKGSTTGRYYFTDYTVTDNSYFRILLDTSDYGGFVTGILNSKYGYYYISKDIDYRFSSFDEIKTVYYENWEYNDTSALINRSVAEKFKLDTYTEEQLPMPTIALAKDPEDNIIGIDVTNNMTEGAGGIELRWFSEEEDAFVWEGYIPNGSTRTFLFDEIEFYNAGTYETINAYCFGIGETIAESSEYASLDYTLSVKDVEYTGEKIKAEYDDTGRYRYIYIPVDQLQGATSIRQLNYRFDDTSEYTTWDRIDSITSDGSRYYYKTWYEGIDTLEVTNIQYDIVKAEESGVTIDKYNVSEEKIETQNSKKTAAPAPSFRFEKDEQGNVTSAFLCNHQNQDGTYVWYGFVTDPEETKVTIENFYRALVMNYNEEEYIDILDYVRYANLQPGTYYLAAYTEGNQDFARSSVAIMDYAIVYKEETIENEITLAVGDMSGDNFLVGCDAENIENTSVHIGVKLDESDESYSQEVYANIDKKWNKLCFKTDSAWGPYWNVVKLTMWNAEYVENAWEVTHFVKTNIPKTGIYEEPKAEAPGIELYYEDGVPKGVKVRNNMTHDNGYVAIKLCADGFENYVWEESLNAGSSKIVRFEEFNYTAIEDYSSDMECQFAAYAWDYNLRAGSQNVMLDYPIKVERKTYSGDTIDITYENVSSNIYVAFIKKNELPNDAFAQKIWYLENEADGIVIKQTTLKSTADDSRWYFTFRLDEPDLRIENLEYSKMVAAEDGATLQVTSTPVEKIKVTNKNTEERNVLFVDYDFYEAFIASGGTITFDGQDVNISTDKFKNQNNIWTLDYWNYKFTGTEVYKFFRNVTSKFEEQANKYWEKFSIKGLFTTDYSTEISDKVISEQTVSGNSLSGNNIVLVKYEPEIVWVDSIKLDAPELVKVGETATVKATPDAGQDKYPFKGTPELRFESSDSSIAAIDAKTGEITGLKDGIVTITVYADETLRAEQNIKEIVTAQVEIEIGHVCEPKITVTKATTSADGKIVEKCKECGKTLSTEKIYKVSEATLSATSYTYNNATKTPTVKVTDSKGNVLMKDTDYTVTYASGRKNVGTYKVTIKLIGNYSGTIEKTFKINKKTITSSMITPISAKTYTGSAIKPGLEIINGSHELVEGTHYTLAYADNVKAGTATVTVTAKGSNYAGTVKTTFVINKKSISDFTVSGLSKKVYTGSALKPTVTVKNGSKTLVNGTDYSVVYSNNTNPGKATVKISGKGNYSGSITKTFIIVPQTATLSSVASGAVGKLTVKWTRDSKATGYVLQYSTSSSFTSSTTKTLTISGNTTVSKTIAGLTEGKTYYVRVAAYKTIDDVQQKGSYSAVKSGKVKASFTVAAISKKTYTGKALTPSVTVKSGSTTLKNGTDYTVSYSNNINPGIATVKVTGKGNYGGTVTKTFIIVPQKATLSSVASTALGKLTVKWVRDSKATGYVLQYSTSSSFTSSTTKTLTISGNSTVSKTISGLTQGKTYYVRVLAYKTIDDVQQKGSYSAVKSARIKANFTVADISKKTYTGKSLTPSVTVKFGSTTLKNGTDYTVSYSNNIKPGTATVKVTGKGNYIGTVTKTFIIVPKKATMSSVTSTATKTLTAKWAKDATASGYALQYSTSSSFTSSTTKTVSITSNGTVSKKLTGLTKGKTYYVRVAAYKTINGTKQFGSYSAAKSVKVK